MDWGREGPPGALCPIFFTSLLHPLELDFLWQLVNVPFLRIATVKLGDFIAHVTVIRELRVDVLHTTF